MEAEEPVVTSGTSAVRADSVTFRYRRWFRRSGRALDAVSWEVQPGSVHALVGANGAGKSTLMKLVAGVLRPDAGTLSVLGEPAGAPSVRAQVSYLPETSDVASRTTVEEGLRVQAALYGVTPGALRERIDAALERTRMTDLRRRQLGSLSKGQRRRAALAQCLLPEPRLLLLDEPFNGVDPVLCEQIRELLKELAATGCTVILSSHLLADVEAAAGSVTLLNGGKVALSGECQDVLEIRDRWCAEGSIGDAMSGTEAVADALRETFGDVQVRHPRRQLVDLLRDGDGSAS